ncbi:LPS export ABC transporter periplasmic protein LptC [Pseudomonas sp. PDM15]|jgi:lipopolysaccharide export system protein LptC|uniref:LPS export ABC transporter periplasmic protein LptC n=1 Tax=Pseudomonas sp. PDM15 TaxID=2769303 RepID=UPI00177B3DA3|nr:LPS export ABC transporter periplasmic protein LptC [Pseudomonas sp. PDM15]MBD9427542.1 LPS export ABC transporter periplasmic protein LptC [Pseudomonas sp. PDM15]
MNGKLRNYVIGLLAVALIGALGYWNVRPETFMDRRAAAEADNAIDFYVVGASTQQFQEDGKLQYEMTAAKLEHIKATDVTLLEKPDLQLYRGTQFPWHVRSDKGEVAPEGKQVELIDNVRIARTDAKNRPTVITSSRVTVFPDEEYAQTQQAVRIEAANGVTTAQGMKAYMNDGKINLLSNVRGQHEVR